mmetsp:Transcript_7341/g.23285  ORF Transcript_7341/g.23285 Transcript_7341/m.23285 type:complete len:153 (-) Transcript_7341:168-626(-)
MLSGVSLRVTAEEGDTVAQMQFSILEEQGVLASRQRLVFNGLALEAHQTLAELRIKDGQALRGRAVPDRETTRTTGPPAAGPGGALARRTWATASGAPLPWTASASVHHPGHGTASVLVQGSDDGESWETAWTQALERKPDWPAIWEDWSMP